MIGATGVGGGLGGVGVGDGGSGAGDLRGSTGVDSRGGSRGTWCGLCSTAGLLVVCVSGEFT